MAKASANVCILDGKIISTPVTTNNTIEFDFKSTTKGKDNQEYHTLVRACLKGEQITALSKKLVTGQRVILDGKLRDNGKVLESFNCTVLD